MDEARRKLTVSPLFDDSSREEAARIIKSLISARATAEGRGAEAESRIDYLADKDYWDSQAEKVIYTVQKT